MHASYRLLDSQWYIERNMLGDIYIRHGLVCCAVNFEVVLYVVLCTAKVAALVFTSLIPN